MPSRLACLHSYGLMGIEGYAVRLEVEVAPGLFHFTLVGLPDPIVSESRERVRCATVSSGLEFPFNHRITVNMAPADVRKEGPLFDLPIALGIQSARGHVDPAVWQHTAAVGELSLDGRVRPVRGALPLAMACRSHGMRRLLLPSESAAEASLVEGLEVWAVETLAEAVAALKKGRAPRPVVRPVAAEADVEWPDLADLRGHHQPRKALEVAAAGGHNVLFIGPPGSGKTMLAQRLPGLLPDLTPEEALGVMQVHSAAGLLKERDRLLLARPFRAPHHSASPGGIVGGGSIPRPGEISLAHHGVLFFDELPEFPRPVLEVLREPLESRQVTLARAATTVTFPADFIFVACMNPCPCGQNGDQERSCRCAARERQRYRSRISGPLLDRIDLVVEVPRDHGDAPPETTSEVRARVQAARDVQRRRLSGSGATCNGRMTLAHMRRFCALGEAAEKALRRGMGARGLSARVMDRVVRVARTLADLEGRDGIDPENILEALGLRDACQMLMGTA